MKNKSLNCYIQQRCLCVVVFIMVMTMSACVTVTPVIAPEDADQNWLTRSEYLYKQQHWTAYLSLIGITDQQKFKTRAVWEQKGEHYTIKLRDFIGRTIAIIEGSPKGVVAKTSKGQRYQGESAEQLIKQLFNIHIPVAGMRHWLLGLPKPDIQVLQLTLNDQGLAEQLSQQGWLMNYPHYLENDPFNMPSQILLGYDDIDLNVKVSRWIFATEQ